METTTLEITSKETGEIYNPVPTQVITKPERELAYVINDNYFQGFEVYKPIKGKGENDDNGWWADRSKVMGLINCFKKGSKVEEACSFIGISVGQYKYFIKLHPAFLTVKERCLIGIKTLIRFGIYNRLVKEDGNMLRWAAENYMPDEFGKQSLPPMGNTNVLNNYGNILTQPMKTDDMDKSVLEDVREYKEEVIHDAEPNNAN